MRRVTSVFLLLIISFSMAISCFTISYGTTDVTESTVIDDFVVDSTETSVTTTGQAISGVALDIKPYNYTINGTDSKWLEIPNNNTSISSIVVNSDYDISNNGNKLVSLENGALVCAAYDNGTIKNLKLFISWDNGATWSLASTSNSLSNLNAFAITSFHNNVYIMIAENGSKVFITKIDCSVNISPAFSFNNFIDNQTLIGQGCSLAVDKNGFLYAAWSSRNASYPNSYNIRYSKSSLGGDSWSSPSQITTYTSNYDAVSPYIYLYEDQPQLVYTVRGFGGYYQYIIVQKFNGSSWVPSTVHTCPTTASNYQESPVSIVYEDGVIHTVWYGKDTSDTAVNNIRYSFSNDGGATWSSPIKITSGNTYDQINPSLFSDKEKVVHIYWNGIIPSSNGGYVVRSVIIQNKKAIAFDGNDDYLTIPNNPDFNLLNTGNFTISFKFKPGLKDTWYRDIFCLSKDNYNFMQAFIQNGYLSFEIKKSGVSTTISTNELISGNLYDINLCFKNGLLYLFVDGVLVRNQTYSSGEINFSSPLFIGVKNVEGIYGGTFLNGQLQDFQIDNGIARYTANFNPKTEKVIVDQYIKLLIKGDNFIDSTGKTISVYGAPTIITQTNIGQADTIDIGINPKVFYEINKLEKRLIIYDGGPNIKFIGAYKSSSTNCSFTLGDLPRNTKHTVIFTVKLADGTTESAIKTIYTKADAPSITASAISTGGILVEVTDDNPPETEYQIMIGDTYVSSTGVISLEPCWIKLSDKKTTIKDTTYKNIYHVKARARNGDGFETAWSPLQSITYQFANLPGLGTIRNVAPGSISVNWTDGGNPIGTLYKVAAFDSDTNTLIKDSTWTSELNYLINGLQTNKTYSIKAKAKNENSIETDWSEIGSITTSFEAPILSTTPHDLAIDLNWSEIVGAYLYELEIDGVVKQIKLLNSYTHEGLKMGSLHTYRIRAKTIYGWSEWSEIYPVITLASPPINKPTNITSRATNNSITLAWGKLPDAEGYEIAEFGGPDLKVPISVGSSLSCEIKGIAPNSTRMYQVRAVNSLGAGPWSDTILVTTYLLSTPANLLVTKTDNSFTLHWNTIPEASSYEISLSNASGSSIYSTAGTTYVITGLPSETQYMYSIRAINSTGSSAWKQETTIATLPTMPSVPQNVFAVVNNEAITIRWDPVNSAEGYDIEVDGVLLENDNTTEYCYTDLQPNQIYTYRVRARNSAVEGYWSEIQTIKTLPGKPLPPKICDVKSSQTGSNIIWQVVPGADDYDLEVSLRENDNNPIVIRGLEDTSYFHRKLITGAEYRYRIRSRNSEGISPWSSYVINNSIRAECTKKQNLDLGLTATDVTDFTPYTMVVSYNSGVLDVLDLCSITGAPELKDGNIEGTDVTVTSFIPGKIIFTVYKVMNDDEAWTGIINSIKFKAKFSGGTTITYSVFCKGEEDL